MMGTLHYVWASRLMALGVGSHHRLTFPRSFSRNYTQTVQSRSIMGGATVVVAKGQIGPGTLLQLCQVFNSKSQRLYIQVAPAARFKYSATLFGMLKNGLWPALHLSTTSKLSGAACFAPATIASCACMGIAWSSSQSMYVLGIVFQGATVSWLLNEGKE